MICSHVTSVAAQAGAAVLHVRALSEADAGLVPLKRVPGASSKLDEPWVFLQRKLS